MAEAATREDRLAPAKGVDAGALIGLGERIGRIGIDDPPQLRFAILGEPGYQGLVADCERELRRVVDPDAADALAKADQRARIAAFGGRETILQRGSFGHSPTPGAKAVYN